MHIAQHTGLTGSKVTLTLKDGSRVYGEIRAECAWFFYFLEHTIAGRAGVWVKAPPGKYAKAEIEQMDIDRP